ncbi:hypothetical protein ScPMuIL_006093 [Solemya velum]
MRDNVAPATHSVINNLMLKTTQSVSCHLEDDSQGYIEGDVEMIDFSNNPPLAPPMSTSYSDRTNLQLPTPVTPPADVEAFQALNEETRKGSTGQLSYRNARDEINIKSYRYSPKAPLTEPIHSQHGYSIQENPVQIPQ